jgi:hypothetical protein
MAKATQHCHSSAGFETVRRVFGHSDETNLTHSSFALELFLKLLGKDATLQIWLFPETQIEIGL